MYNLFKKRNFTKSYGIKKSSNYFLIITAFKIYTEYFSCMLYFRISLYWLFEDKIMLFILK